MYRAPYTLYEDGIYADDTFEGGSFNSVFTFAHICDAANAWADCDSPYACVYDAGGIRIPNSDLWEIVEG